MANRDDSVMTALGELARIEEERIAARRREDEARAREDEARARAAQERAAQERAAQEAEREHARLVAEAEAKARAEAAILRDGSLEALRLQIAAVQADREAMREELRARAATAGGAERAGRGPWALAFGLSSVVAAGLAGVLVMQQQAIVVARAEAAPIERAAPALVTPRLAAEPSAPDEDGRALASAEAATADVTVPPLRAAAERPRVRAPRDRERARERRDAEHERDLSQVLDLDGDDDGAVLSDRFLREATRGR